MYQDRRYKNNPTYREWKKSYQRRRYAEDPAYKEQLAKYRDSDECRASRRGVRNRYNNRLRLLINDAKSAPCNICNKHYPHVCMDLHHREGEVKLFSLSKYSGKSFETVRAEIAKCDLLCANCHRLTHFAKIGSK